MNINREKHNQRELTESIKQMSQQLTRTQITTTESAVRESLKSICGHKAFIDSISQGMLLGIQKSLENTFKKSLEEIMIPSYEKITHEMFQEMGKAFTAGTKECKFKFIRCCLIGFKILINFNIFYEII